MKKCTLINFKIVITWDEKKSSILTSKKSHRLSHVYVRYTIYRMEKSIFLISISSTYVAFKNISRRNIRIPATAMALLHNSLPIDVAMIATLIL